MTIQELINRLEVLYDATYEDAPGEAADAVCKFLTSVTTASLYLYHLLSIGLLQKAKKWAEGPLSP